MENKHKKDSFSFIFRQVVDAEVITGFRQAVFCVLWRLLFLSLSSASLKLNLALLIISYL